MFLCVFKLLITHSVNGTAKSFNQHGYEIWLKLEKV